MKYTVPSRVYEGCVSVLHMLCWCTCVNGPANELPLHSQSSLGRKSLQSSPAPLLWTRHVNIREKSAICLHSLLINPGSGVINSPLLCITFLKTLGCSMQVGKKKKQSRDVSGELWHFCSIRLKGDVVQLGHRFTSPATTRKHSWRKYGTESFPGNCSVVRRQNGRFCNLISIFYWGYERYKAD